MKLYHASTVVIEKPDVLHSRDKLDFGKGFYLTAIREQALRYAERFTIRGKDAYVNEYDFDEVTSGYVIKSFPTYDEEWLDYLQSMEEEPTPPKGYTKSGIRIYHVNSRVAYDNKY